MPKHNEARYEALIKQLVSHIFQFEETDINYGRSVRYALSNLLYHHCLDVNERSVKRNLEGIAFKMEIHGLREKAAKLSGITDQFLKSPILSQKGDLKWNILSLLLHLSYHPARDDVSLSNHIEMLESTESIQELTDSEWRTDGPELFFNWPEKDDTLSEWSDFDEETQLSEMMKSHERSFNEKISSNGPEREENNIATVNDEVSKWFSENIQSPLWNSLRDINHRGDYKATEYIVIRECLWILMHPAPGFVFEENGSKFSIRSITTATISKECLTNVLTPICTAAGYMKTINEWLLHEPVDLIMTGTLKSYREVLWKWKKKYLLKLTEIEGEFSNGAINQTIGMLTPKLDSLLHTLCVLHNIYLTVIVLNPKEPADMKSFRLIGLLIFEIDNSVFPDSKCTLIDILIGTLKYLLTSLELWLWESSQLPFDDFGIKVDPAPSNSLNTTPTYRRKEEVFSLKGLQFFESVQEAICEAANLKYSLQSLNSESVVGKRKNLSILLENEICKSNICPTESSPLRMISPPLEYSDPFLKMAFELDMPRAKATPTEKHIDCYKKNMNMANILSSVLVPVILDYATEARLNMTRLLKENYQLAEHVKLFKSAALLEKGDLLSQFYSHLFSVIDNKEILNETELTLQLKFCFEDSFPDLYENFIIYLNLPNNFHLLEDENYIRIFFQNLTLEYKSVWPISLVLNKEVTSRYSKLFSFCLTLKKGVVTLEKLNFKDFSTSSVFAEEKDDSLDLCPTQNELPLNRRIHRLQLIRHWLLYFSRTIHDHFYISNIIPFSHSVDTLLQMDCHYKKLIEEHSKLLDEVSRECLFKMARIKNILYKTLSLINKVKVLWLGNVRNITEDTLHSLEEEYTTCHRLLARFFSTLSKTDYCVYFEKLADSLITNCPIIDFNNFAKNGSHAAFL